MRNTIDKLQEKRQIELAKSILESKGYTISKENSLQEASSWTDESNPYDRDSIYYTKNSGVFNAVIRNVGYDKIQGIVQSDKEVLMRTEEMPASQLSQCMTKIDNWIDSYEGIEENMQESTEVSEDVETRRADNTNWDEEMKSKVFPIGKDQLRSFSSYLRSRGYSKDQNKRPAGEKMYINNKTGEKVFISKTWYGNYHVEIE